MIPATLIDNPTLHSIVLTQIILETLTGVMIPRGPPGNNFTYCMNTKEMMIWDLDRKNEFGSLSQTKHWKLTLRSNDLVKLRSIRCCFVIIHNYLLIKNYLVLVFDTRIICA